MLVAYANCGVEKIICKEKRGKELKRKNKKILTCRRVDKS